VCREHLIEVGKRIPPQGNIKQIHEILDHRIEGFQFEFYVLSAAPVEVIQSALEDVVPGPHFCSGVRYGPSGEIESLVRVTAGYGKVARSS
jgi:hypothetical protein